MIYNPQLIAAIRADPDNLSLYRIYADWLEENGEDDVIVAELRRCIEAVEKPTFDAAPAEMAAEMAAEFGAMQPYCRRGLPWMICIRWNNWQTHHKDLLARYPIRCVQLTGMDGIEIRLKVNGEELYIERLEPDNWDDLAKVVKTMWPDIEFLSYLP